MVVIINEKKNHKRKKNSSGERSMVLCFFSFVKRKSCCIEGSKGEVQKLNLFYVCLQKMVQEGGTPGETKTKSVERQKKISTLENELELRFVQQE